MTTTITENGARLAMLDSLRENDRKAMARDIQALRAKQEDVMRMQREANIIAQKILVTKRKIDETTEEMEKIVAGSGE